MYAETREQAREAVTRFATEYGPKYPRDSLAGSFFDRSEIHELTRERHRANLTRLSRFPEAFGQQRERLLPWSGDRIEAPTAFGSVVSQFDSGFHSDDRESAR
jgi:hypothetical protein